jgi:hypothetical protein
MAFDLLQKELYEPELGSYLGATIKSAEKKVSAFFKRRPKGLKYVIQRLPTYYALGFRKIGGAVRAYLRPIGKVLGTYDPHTDTIAIDPINLLDRNLLEHTLVHELVHYYQKILGYLKIYPRALIERMASYITDRKIYKGLRGLGSYLKGVLQRSLFCEV